MIKNTRNNRLMGSIDGPYDVSYRLFVRDFIEDGEKFHWTSSPFLYVSVMVKFPSLSKYSARPSCFPSL